MYVSASFSSIKTKRPSNSCPIATRRQTGYLHSFIIQWPSPSLDGLWPALQLTGKHMVTLNSLLIRGIFTEYGKYQLSKQKHVLIKWQTVEAAWQQWFDVCQDCKMSLAPKIHCCWYKWYKFWKFAILILFKSCCFSRTSF